MRLSQYRVLMACAVLIFSSGAIALAQEMTSKKVSHLTYVSLSKEQVAVFRPHRFVRQVGLSMARWTAPDLADEAVVAYTYTVASFDPKQRKELWQFLLNADVAELNADIAVATKLKEGDYAVMHPSQAKNWDLIHFVDPKFDPEDLKAISGIVIVSGSKELMGATPVGTISHWKDRKLPAEIFVKLLKARPATKANPPTK